MRLKITDQLQLIKKFASDIYTIMQRMSPVFALLRSTARTDPEIMALMNKLLMERLDGMSFFVNQLSRIGPMKEQTLTNQANVSVWAISSAEVFTLMTQDLGWSKEEYTAWLSSSLERLLIPEQ